MDPNLKTGGKIDSASALTALQSLKHVTCSTPRQLTESEIKLLKHSKVEVAMRIVELSQRSKNN